MKSIIDKENSDFVSFQLIAYNIYSAPFSMTIAGEKLKPRNNSINLITN